MDNSISGAESATRLMQVDAPTCSNVAQENPLRAIPLIKEKCLADLSEALRLNKSEKFLHIGPKNFSGNIEGCDDIERHADMTAGSPPSSAIPIRAMTAIPTFPVITAATATAQSHFNLTLAALNHCDATEFANLLKNVYYQPWITQHVAVSRPFPTVMALKFAFQQAVKEASEDDKLRLLCAYPELADSATISNTFSAESSAEQTGAGLKQCTPEELVKLQTQNANYHKKFGFPFVLALRGLQESGPLLRERVIDESKRRLQNPRDTEIAESLQQIHLIAEFRLDDRIAKDVSHQQ